MTITAEQRAKLRDLAALELGRLIMSGSYTLAERVDMIGTDNKTVHSPVASPDTENVDGLVAAAKRIAEQRTSWLLSLRTALQAHDHKQTQVWAELLTGLREEEAAIQ
jgi:hypothetical protein